MSMCTVALIGGTVCLSVIRKNRTGGPGATQEQHENNTRTTEKEQEKARKRERDTERHKTNKETPADPARGRRRRQKKSKGSARAGTTREAQQEPQKHTSRTNPSRIQTSHGASRDDARSAAGAAKTHTKQKV